MPATLIFNPYGIVAMTIAARKHRLSGIDGRRQRHHDHTGRTQRTPIVEMATPFIHATIEHWPGPTADHN